MNNINLTCSYLKCQKYLLEPISLECTSNVCRSHVVELIDHSKEVFKCFVCEKKHKVPADGFVLNSNLNQTLLLQAHLNANEKNASDLINKVNMSYYELKNIANDPESFFFDYIADVRNKIDLERERLIYEINSLSDELLVKLKRFEDECRQNYMKIKEINKHYNIYLSNLAKEISRFNETLRTPTLSEQKVNKIILDAKKLVKETEKKISNYKNGLLIGQTFSFHGMNTKFEHKHFGKLYFITSADFECLEDINSFKPSFLTSSESADLVKLCEFSSNVEFQLLYQATRDGFSAKSFHAKCDNKQNTLVIIKVVGQPNVFGGFSNVNWDVFSEKKSDPKAFIFSLINSKNMPMKFNATDSSCSIYCNKEFGPTFGSGHDICISNNSNNNQKSYSNFGFSYKNNSYPYLSTRAQSFLAGSYKFITQEIEVYQVLFEYSTYKS